MIVLNLATDKDKEQNQFLTLNKSDYGVVVQSWHWLLVEIMDW